MGYGGRRRGFAGGGRRRSNIVSRRFLFPGGGHRIDSDRRWWRRRRETAGFGHAAHGTHQGGVLDHHGDGGPGNTVNGDLAFHAAADDDVIEYGFALVLARESLQAFLGDAHHQNRFLMFDNANADDASREIETDQRVDGMTGIGRYADDIARQERIAEQALALINGGGQRLAFEGAEAIRPREEGFHRRIQLINGLGVRRDRHAHEQAQRQQAKDNGREFHETLMRGQAGILEKAEASLIQGDYRSLDFCQLPD